MQISVYPNPFVALGADGMPCGRCLVEPSHPRPLEPIGGKIKRVVMPHEADESRTAKEVAASRKLDVRDARVKGVAEARMRPNVVMLSQYWKERVASGDVIAADKASAAACHVTQFKQPIDVLRAAMAQQITAWKAINGEPPALANFELVQNAEEIALVQKDSKPVKPPTDTPA